MTDKMHRYIYLNVIVIIQCVFVYRFHYLLCSD